MTVYRSNVSVDLSTVSHETSENLKETSVLPLDSCQQTNYHNRMVEIPEPLPRDVAALHKLIRELAREIQQDRHRIELMERLLKRLERLVGNEDEQPVE